MMNAQMARWGADQDEGPSGPSCQFSVCLSVAGVGLVGTIRDFGHIACWNDFGS